MSEALWITEGEVVSLLALPEVIEALRWGLGEQAAGRASNMTKTQLTWGGGSTLHAIGALFESGPIVGTKTWTHTKGGANPLLLLFDAGKGKLLAVIEAFALGQMRTAGISGLATDHLADSAARTMAMIGTGKQSLAQVAAVAAVRPLERVAIWSPTEANRRALAEKVRDRRIAGRSSGGGFGRHFGDAGRSALYFARCACDWRASQCHRRNRAGPD